MTVLDQLVMNSRSSFSHCHYDQDGETGIITEERSTLCPKQQMMSTSRLFLSELRPESYLKPGLSLDC